MPSLEVCAARDHKGNYERAHRGELGTFIGVTEPYQETPNPEPVIDTSQVAAADALSMTIDTLVLECDHPIDTTWR